MLHNKNYKSGLTDSESRLNNYLKSGNSLRTAATVYTLPVVFHVVTNGGVIGAADNPSDANILATLKLLNDTWSKNRISYGGADLQIQFALAQRSLTCGSTNGINRVNGSVVQWESKSKCFSQSGGQ
ncbi:hypothetical protein ACFP1I_13440 [Dyadobacter subterraneus]|uniref:Uncharacterized protein n=1 Tax=Dyadobacter subterraneus TaxID=2773304 RepID=A0ABR9W9S5_9BACT|nr:hypothetical protein [Dyadobacter subterraneus]MBE9462237.1 hypothetical protein [Dyadobacter subterraneus]